MFKSSIVLFSAALLAGCGNVDRAVASLTGNSVLCIDNVEYIQFTSGATVKYKPDGSISTCK